MKNTIKLAILTGCALLASCGEGKHPSSPEISPLKIETISEVLNSSSSTTFVPYLNGVSSIGVCVTDRHNMGYGRNGMNQLVECSLENESWKLKKPVFVDAPGYVYVFSPYQEIDIPFIPLDTRNKNEVLANSVPISFDKENTNISVNLSHLYAKMSVSIKGREISSIRLEHPTTCNYNLFTGMYSDVSQNEVQSENSSEMFIIPTVGEVSYHLSITLNDGRNYDYDLPATIYQAGVEYDIPFVLSEDETKLEINTITVKDYKVVEHDRIIV